MHEIKPSNRPLPRYQRIPAFCHTWGTSRSSVYRLLAAGHIRAVKLGDATLIDCMSADAYFASLPPAQVRAAKPQSIAA